MKNSMIRSYRTDIMNALIFYTDFRIHNTTGFAITQTSFVIPLVSDIPSAFFRESW